MSGIIGMWGEKKDIGCSWVEKVNPGGAGWEGGGLIYVTDDFYKFIRKIECTIQEVLNIKLIVAYAGENLRNDLLEKLK